MVERHPRCTVDDVEEDLRDECRLVVLGVAAEVELQVAAEHELGELLLETVQRQLEPRELLFRQTESNLSASDSRYH
ncbi:hypothetical protein [Streptomyces sp. NPDC093591]|uniref:hypothetical protein n=1 Tax=Streptomyces sp. NPDC093591 TaxID=3366044 RepID=UPI00381790B3